MLRILVHNRPDTCERLTAGRSLFLSECHALPIMTKNAKTLGGTVKSWASSVLVSIAFVPLKFEHTASETQIGNDSRCKVPESVQRILRGLAKFRIFRERRRFGQTSRHLERLSTHGEEEVLDREIPELPAGQGIDEILFIKVLVGSYPVRTQTEIATKAYLEEQKVPYGRCRNHVLPASRTWQSRDNLVRRTR